MRVTNNMITSNTKSNINSNKVLVDKYNTQMTTQKKIERPSENPVIAIRSLRLQTSLSHVEQYLDNNIATVEGWLDITDTALVNINKLLTDARSLCNHGATDTLTAEDRQTLLNQLRALQDQIYCELNADNAGRTVFTGYRTNDQLTFNANEKETTYEIDQTLDFHDLMESRYYYGQTSMPSADNVKDGEQCETEMGVQTYNRFRLAYDGLNSLNTNGGVDDVTGLREETHKIVLVDKTVDPPVESAKEVKEYDSVEAWRAADASMTIGDDDIVFIKGTGELILGKNIADSISTGKSELKVTYTKTGFERGEAKPEYYYDCRKRTSEMADTDPSLKFTKENQEIEFEISSGIMLAANTQASDVLDTAIYRDMTEMMDVISTAIAAHDKVDRIKLMKSRAEYADPESQKVLQTYLDAAENEAVYADDNIKKTYQQYLSSFDYYMNKTDIAHTNLGSMQQRLALTKTRVENQKVTVEQLKTNTENREISDIIIDYYAAYNAYTGSLTAASKVQQQTLLNYI